MKTGVYKLTLLFLMFFVFRISNAQPQLSLWEFGGYAKNMLTYADGDFEAFPVEFGKWQNTAQLRLNSSVYPLSNLSGTLQARTLMVYQENSANLRSFQEQLQTNSSYYFNMKWEWLDKSDIYGFTEIDRLSLDWNYDDLQMTLGRQRIAWGTCLVWNPTDLFNPFDILDFDYEERPGTDALHVQYYTGPLSQFNFAATPGETRNEVIYSARYQTNMWNYDFSLIAGWQRNSLRLAFNWAGEVFDGGFRGEMLYTDPDMVFTTYNPEATGLYDLFIEYQISKPYWTIALSYDYTFENSFYIHTEYLYNGLGTTENAGARRFEIIFTGELTPARNSLYQEFAYQITPLFRANFFVIYNPNDQSWIAAPSLQYSVATNWEAFVLAFPSGGDVGTEYGGYPTQYFVRLKYSF